MKRFSFTLMALFFLCFAKAQNTGPKNIIVLIGDGMGFEHINTALYYNGNSQENIWKSFPVNLSASTGSYEIQYSPADAWKQKDYVTTAFTESSAAATAMSTSVKTRPGMIGMGPDTIPLVNPVQLAFTKGKSSGVVTTVPFCHATPAGFCSHNISRKNYGEIAFEMLVHSPLTVIMGAGHPWYDNDGKKKDIADYEHIGTPDVWTQVGSGMRESKKEKHLNDIEEIACDGISDEWFFSDDFNHLQKQMTDGKEMKRLFFLAPVYTATQYGRSDTSVIPWDVPLNESIPSLTEMSLLALDFLSDDPDGFFLMIEGGAIDWAAHDNDLPRLIEEQTEFEHAVESVVQWVSDRKIWKETLVIVLADHETGYLCSSFDQQDGFVHIRDNGKGQLPDASFLSHNHTNHLVPFFARGRGSHIFELLAADFDPVRGKYLHIGNVGHVIKHLWGDVAVAYPASLNVCEGEQVNIVASAPYDGCSYQWVVNGKVLEDVNSPFLTTKLNDSSELYCIISCADRFYKTNIVHIKIESCR